MVILYFILCFFTFTHRHTSQVSLPEEGSTLRSLTPRALEKMERCGLILKVKLSNKALQASVKGSHRIKRLPIAVRINLPLCPLAVLPLEIHSKQVENERAPIWISEKLFKDGLFFIKTTCWYTTELIILEFAYKEKITKKTCIFFFVTELKREQ